MVDKAAFENSFGFVLVKSDKERYVVKCQDKRCEWKLRAAKVLNTRFCFSIRTHHKMHTCSRASQSTVKKRKGTPDLVACLLHGDYPGSMETPNPGTIQKLVQTRFGVKISYSTALRGKNRHAYDLRGDPGESYKKLYCYLHMLEKVNEGFQCMRKVITVDATHLKNGYRGVLVFASAQDPNRHNYPLAFGVLDSENNDSWNWFFELLKSVIPDSSELVFMTDRNESLINAVAYVYPRAHHGYCVWHLSQNVKDHAFNVNKGVVSFYFREMSRHYTVAAFEAAYSSFEARFPSAAAYLVKTTNNRKETWARVHFPGVRYNLDTSNCVESLNSTFRPARRYALIPMLDAIIAQISKWFNEHRKEAAAGSEAHKLVPLVENLMHDMWKEAEKLHATELNSFELLYDVVAKKSDGTADPESKNYSVDLIRKSCSCRVFDFEKIPCVHALAAFMEFNTSNVDSSRYPMQLIELVSHYYLIEVWQLAYWRTIFLVPHESEWKVPEDVKAKKIIPLQPIPKKGRKRTKRLFGPGEYRRPRTANKRRKRQGIVWGDLEKGSQPSPDPEVV
ncbi:unnamed protein product [Microthlaspi erraticum]|uniref:SWIM-type domain-containing protein n=1 Tax=Microthlaspi erraticum TaxID=1685480 RepID=A0A6D2KZ19_9BRAS|nr:unnamed protein product [Microthlaspi erraticum]